MLLLVALLPPAGGAIRGIVVDAHGGTPLQHVSIRLIADGRTVVTDAAGQFEIPDVPAGAQELFVSAVDFPLVKQAVTVTEGATVEIAIALSGGPTSYTETVTVVGAENPARARAPEVTAAQTLSSTELQQSRGLLTNDPLRAVQMLPGAATGDDFRSEFAVRGLAVPDMNFTFEGIASPFLVHTVQNLHDSGSVAMINGDVLEEMTLLNGGFPERYGNRLGAQLDLRMREGSRQRLQSHVSVSMTDAALVVEGPLAASARGSWLTSIRKSYLDFALKRLSATEGVAFGFEDAQAKLVYDLTTRHQVQFAVTAGQSELSLDPLPLNVNSLQKGTNASAVAVATWRYLPSPRVSLYQRAAFTTNEFRSTTKDAVTLDRGRTSDALYRADWTVTRSPRLAFEGGGELRSSAMVQRQQVPASGGPRPVNDIDASSAAGSAYGQVRWLLQRGASITPGVRVDHWTLTGHTAASPWVGTSWPVRGSLVLRAGGGLYRQDPGFLETQGVHGSPDLPGQYAWDLDVGLEGRLPYSSRWQMTLYDREDRQRLRPQPGAEDHAVNDRFVSGAVAWHYANVLNGSARGVEFVLQRQAPNGIAGWISYAYSQNRYEDRVTGESFWGDFDQRHTLNLFGMYRFSDRLSTSARFRVGSNFPATGYFREAAGVEYLNDVRNTRWIPTYARLDARVNRTFNWERTRMTLFVETLNVLNHHNVRLGTPSVNRRTLVASDLFDTTIPILPSAGLLFEF